MGRAIGKVVLITGATSGIGRGTALYLAAEGYRVAVAGRNLAAGEAVRDEILAAGGKAIFVRVDVTDDAAWGEAIKTVVSTWGGIDTLVNNAGECVLASMNELTQDHLSFLRRINIEAAFLGFRHGMPAIRAAGGGSIINIASVAGLKAAAGSTIYSATKAALTDLMEAMAEAGRGMPHVSVHTIYPGLIWLDTAVTTLGEKKAFALRDAVVSRTPIGCVGTPEDIAAAVALLISQSGPAFTAQALVIDGGYSFS